MKTLNKLYNRDDNVSELLQDVLGNKAAAATKALSKRRINTIGQFAGALISIAPSMTESQMKQRQMACSAAALKKSKSPRNAMRKIRLTLGVTTKEAEQIFNALQNVRKSFQSYRVSLNWAFGSKKSPKTQQKSSDFWVKFKPKRKSAGFFILPSYNNMGPVFDQGGRGTCVANASTSLIDYLGVSQYSRQFLYHQCKMLDGSKDSEGTYIHIPFIILEDTEYLDYGCVQEKTWPYDPNEKDTTHHGPPPEEAFDCQRVVSTGTIFPRQNIIVDDIIDLVTSGLPVVIGVPLYESFISYETYQTGWVTMPLEGEVIYGYHAMLIVGYDENMKMFLVRNSWSASWASQNEKGYPGHALMPYEYIKEYCFSSATVPDVYEEHIYVEPADRLYNNSTAAKRLKLQKKAALIRKNRKMVPGSSGRRSATKPGNVNSSRKSNKKNSLASWLFKLAVIILLVKVFQEPLMNVAERSYEFIANKVSIEAIGSKVNELIK